MTNGELGRKRSVAMSKIGVAADSIAGSLGLDAGLVEGLIVPVGKGAEIALLRRLEAAADLLEAIALKLGLAIYVPDGNLPAPAPAPAPAPEAVQPLTVGGTDVVQPLTVGGTDVVVPLTVGGPTLAGTGQTTAGDTVGTATGSAAATGKAKGKK